MRASRRECDARGKDTDSIEAQIRQLEHPSFHERFRAQTALIGKGKSALAAATAALANAATAPLAARHLVWVVDAIAGGTPEASYPLIESLKSPSRDVRAQAARALGERAVPIAVEPLVKRLKDGELAGSTPGGDRTGPDRSRRGNSRHLAPGRRERRIPGLLGPAGDATNW